MAISDPWQCDINDLKRQAGLGPLPPKPEQSQEEESVDKAFAEFQSRYPAFKANPHNKAALFLHLNNWPATVQGFREAHARATYERLYNDAAPQIVNAEQAESVDLQTLRDAAFGVTDRDPAWDMEMSDLKKEAGLES